MCAKIMTDLIKSIENNEKLEKLIVEYKKELSAIDTRIKAKEMLVHADVSKFFNEVVRPKLVTTTDKDAVDDMLNTIAKGHSEKTLLAQDYAGSDVSEEDVEWSNLKSIEVNITFDFF